MTMSQRKQSYIEWDTEAYIGNYDTITKVNVNMSCLPIIFYIHSAFGHNYFEGGGSKTH